MRLSSSIAKIVSAVIFLVTLAFALEACEPLITFRVQNQTHETLKVYRDDLFLGEAIAGGEVKFEIEVIYPTYNIIAKDMDGNVVYTANFTRKDISGKRTYRVVIPPRGKDAR